MNKNKYPNFMCVGAQKAGTTTVFEILRQHSHIYLHPKKELHFFDREEEYKKGFNWYINTYFNNVKKEMAIGEITPNYMCEEYVPERIYKDLGANIKLIFILRNPANRAFSHYNMNINRGLKNKSFDFIVNNWKENEINSTDVAYHFIKRGFYDVQIQNFLHYFNKENCLFLLFEKDIEQNIDITIKKIQDFLVLPKEKLNSNIKLNVAGINKSQKIDTILNTKNPINTIAKYSIPNKRIRNNIKLFISKRNKREIDNTELMKFKNHMIKNIYYNSIKETEKIIGQDLSIWYK